MKVYLAARYSRIDRLRAVRERLRAAGHTVTSRWLDTDWPRGEHGTSSAAPPEERARVAHMDYDDVVKADAVVSFAEEPRAGRGGRHVEFGVALALGKHVALVGKPEHVFHHFCGVELLDSDSDAVRWVESLGKRPRTVATFAEYQVQAASTAVYPGQGDFAGLWYALTALGGEVGEVLNKTKKFVRGDYGADRHSFEAHLVKELGGAQWYISACCTELSVPLESLASANLQLLAGRESRGTLKSGAHSEDRP